MFEDKHTEFKSKFVDEIKKTVVAFANTDGGTLYIGINNDGSVCGVVDADDCLLRVSNTIRDSIKPDVSSFCNTTVEQMDGQTVIRLEVQQGTSRPYYIAGKGIRPKGVYVRQGASNAPASKTVILNMIKESSGDNYEEARSLNQQLTFEYADKYFADKKIAFGEQQKRTLKLIDKDNSYTNLALLLSDQCMHTIRFAVFEGDSKTSFKDRREFSGSLLKQLEEAFAYIDMFNRTSSKFVGLDRIDKRAYPVEAIREALLNAIVHRDYGYSASTLISIFDNRIEFVTVGGLIKGFTKNDIMLGISVLRNRNLADVFYRLKLIEAYGVGLPKINECYSDSVQKPKIEISDNAFKISLPNTVLDIPPKTDDLSEREKAIISLLGDREMTRPDIQNAVGCSQTTAITTLNRLVEHGYLIKTGKGINTKYKKSN